MCYREWLVLAKQRGGVRLQMNQQQQAQDALIRKLADVSPLELPAVVSQVALLFRMRVCRATWRMYASRAPAPCTHAWAHAQHVTLRLQTSESVCRTIIHVDLCSAKDSPVCAN